MSKHLKPIIKYSGGKGSEIDTIKPFIPDKINTYIEPFIGGGALYFYLNNDKNIINDINPKLINLYNTIKNNNELIIRELKTLENTEECYYEIRKMYNNKIDLKYDEATIYMYINKTCYRGLIRYNQKGEFNVPFGHYKTYHPWDYINEDHINLLKNTEVYNYDFAKIFNMAGKGDFMFLDPPYMSSFSSYTPDGFTEEDQRRLAECFKKSKANCMMVISDLGIIRELYKDYIVYEYDKTYAVNIGSNFEPVTAKHLVICNYKI